MEDTDRWMGFIPVLGMPTCVLKFGTISQETKHLFLIIPGNPGVIEYYDQFMRRLFSRNGGNIPVWGVSHAGHVTPEGGNKDLHKLVSYDVCTLTGQIRHKHSFINENIPKDVKIFLIGHSIGCYMNLKIINQTEHKIERCFQLFPTIERMAMSPNGRVFTPTLKYFRWVATMISYFVSFFPTDLKRQLIKWHFSGQNRGKTVPASIQNATLSFIHPTAVSNSVFMAHQEMRIVDRLDEELVRKHLPRSSYYFGQADKWCPQQYYLELKDKFPDGDIRLCSHGYSHAFVVDASVEMADVVCDWAKPFV